MSIAYNTAAAPSKSAMRQRDTREIKVPTLVKKRL